MLLWVGVTNLMLLSAALLALVLFLSPHAERMVPEGSRSVPAIKTADPQGNVLAQILGGFRVVAHSGYLVRIVLFVMPIVMIVNYGLILFVPVFAVVRVMMIIENATNMSMGNTTNHTLYLPVTREETYVGKTTIDTFFARFGDLLSAGLVMLTAQFLGLEVGWMVAINLSLALALFALGNAIGKYHRNEIRHHLENLPPVVSKRLPDVYVPAGQILMFSVPDQAFIDPEPGDALRFHARTADGSPLPGWIRFDPHNHSFTIRPPAGSSGTLDVKLSATDFEGLSVDSGFAGSYGADPTPRFIAAPAATTPG